MPAWVATCKKACSWYEKRKRDDFAELLLLLLLLLYIYIIIIIPEVQKER